MRKKYKAIFIVRKINDMDHMLPIIYQFIETNNNVRVVTLDIKKIENYLTNYMRNKLGVTVETPVLDSMNVFTKYFISACDILLFFVKNKNWSRFSKYLEYAYLKLKKNILAYEDSKDKTCNTIFDCSNTDIIVVDKTNVIKNKIYKNITRHASTNNIPIIRIQHGINTIKINKDIESEKDPYILVHDYGGEVYETYYSLTEVYQHQLDCLKNGFSKKIRKDKIMQYVLGNMRYSKNWIDKYKEIQKFDEVEDPNLDLNKKTILIIMSASHFIYIDKVASLIDFISSRLDINIIYKPHTRKEEIDYKIKDMVNNDVDIVYSYKCTASLIDISDLVLVCGISSAAIHSVISLKPTVFAEYVSRRKTYYSEYFRECTTMSKQETLRNIENALNNGTTCDYAYDFMREFIDPNDSDNIIQDYYDLICNIIENSNNINKNKAIC